MYYRVIDHSVLSSHYKLFHCRTVWSSENSRWGSVMKENKPVDIPMELDLSSYITGGYEKLDNNYSVYAAIIHHGTASYGHYVALCQAPNSQWYLYDDERVSQAAPNQVSGMLKTAYILFFKRKGMVPLPTKEDITLVHATARNLAIGYTGEEVEKLDLLFGVDKAEDEPRPTENSPSDVESEVSTVAGSETSTIPSPSSRRSPRARFFSRRLDNLVRLARHLKMASHLKTSLSPNSKKLVVPTQSISVAVSPTSLLTKERMLPSSAVTETGCRVGPTLQSFSRSAPSPTTFKSFNPKIADQDVCIEKWDELSLDTEEFDRLVTKTKRNSKRALPVSKRQMHDMEYDQGRLKKFKDPFRNGTYDTT